MVTVSFDHIFGGLVGLDCGNVSRFAWAEAAEKVEILDSGILERFE